MQEAALAQAKPAPPSDVDKAPRVSPPARSAQSYLRASNDPIAPEDNDLTIWDNRRAHALMARPHGRAVADMVELQRVAWLGDVADPQAGQQIDSASGGDRSSLGSSQRGNGGGWRGRSAAPFAGVLQAAQLHRL